MAHELKLALQQDLKIWITFSMRDSHGRRLVLLTYPLGIFPKAINKRTIIGWERDGRYPRSIEMLEKMADIFHVPLTYLQPDQSLFIERAAEAYGKKGKIEAQHLAFELTELFASGELTPQDMDGIMYEMHKAYFKYREQKREKERIMNL